MRIDEDKLGMAANIIQVFGLGLALMIAFQFLNLFDRMLYWASVLALTMAFAAGMLLSNQERRLTRALWIVSTVITLVVVIYALGIIGVR